MRLLWAGVLLLMLLVVELAEAQRCSGTPDAPEYATVRCFFKRNTCRAQCQPGYFFSDKNSRYAAYYCEGGKWVMKGGHADRCDPECDPPCENGECIEPDTCACDDGFTGDVCDEEEYEEYMMSTTEEPTYEGYEEDNYGDEDAYSEEADADYEVEDYDEDYEDVDVEIEEEDGEEDDEEEESTPEPEGGEDEDETDEDGDGDDENQQEGDDEHDDSGKDEVTFSRLWCRLFSRSMGALFSAVPGQGKTTQKSSNRGFDTETNFGN